MDAATVGLLTGSIGVLGTLGGVVFTQWRADVREGKRLAVEERREQQRLDHDAARELDARLFDHRRNAYVAVIEQYHRWDAVADGIANGLHPAPPEDAMNDFWRVLSEVDLYGSAEAGKKALDLYMAMRKLVYGPHRTADDGEDAFVTAVERHRDFVQAVRADLGTTPRWVLKPGLKIDGVAVEPDYLDEGDE